MNSSFSFLATTPSKAYDLEMRLQDLAARRDTLEKRTKEKQQLLHEFSNARNESLSRLVKSFNEQNEQAKQRNMALLQDVVITMHQSSKKTAAVLASDLDSPLNTSGGNTSKSQLLAAKKAYLKSLEHALPLAHRQEAIRLEEKMKKLKMEKLQSMQRREKLRHELMREERVRYELESQRQELVQTLALEQSDILRSKASSLLIAEESKLADAEAVQHIAQMGQQLSASIQQRLWEKQQAGIFPQFAPGVAHSSSFHPNMGAAVDNVSTFQEEMIERAEHAQRQQEQFPSHKHQKVSPAMQAALLATQNSAAYSNSITSVTAVAPSLPTGVDTTVEPSRSKKNVHYSSVPEEPIFSLDDAAPVHSYHHTRTEAPVADLPAPAPSSSYKQVHAQHVPKNTAASTAPIVSAPIADEKASPAISPVVPLRTSTEVRSFADYYERQMSLEEDDEDELEEKLNDDRDRHDSVRAEFKADTKGIDVPLPKQQQQQQVTSRNDEAAPVPIPPVRNTIESISTSSKPEAKFSAIERLARRDLRSAGEDDEDSMSQSVVLPMAPVQSARREDESDEFGTNSSSISQTNMHNSSSINNNKNSATRVASESRVPIVEDKSSILPEEDEGETINLHDVPIETVIKVLCPPPSSSASTSSVPYLLPMILSKRDEVNEVTDMYRIEDLFTSSGSPKSTSQSSRTRHVRKATRLIQWLLQAHGLLPNSDSSMEGNKDINMFSAVESGNALLLLLAYHGAQLVPRECVTGVVTLDKLKKELKRMSNQGGSQALFWWEEMLRHGQQLIHATPSPVSAAGKKSTKSSSANKWNSLSTNDVDDDEFNDHSMNPSDQSVHISLAADSLAKVFARAIVDYVHPFALVKRSAPAQNHPPPTTTITTTTTNAATEEFERMQRKMYNLFQLELLSCPSSAPPSSSAANPLRFSHDLSLPSSSSPGMKGNLPPSLPHHQQQQQQYHSNVQEGSSSSSNNSGTSPGMKGGSQRLPPFQFPSSDDGRGTSSSPVKTIHNNSTTQTSKATTAMWMLDDDEIASDEEWGKPPVVKDLDAELQQGKKAGAPTPKAKAAPKPRNDDDDDVFDF
jgi:hypothetical protein